MMIVVVVVIGMRAGAHFCAQRRARARAKGRPRFEIESLQPSRFRAVRACESELKIESHRQCRPHCHHYYGVSYVYVYLWLPTGSARAKFGARPRQHVPPPTVFDYIHLCAARPKRCAGQSREQLVCAAGSECLRLPALRKLCALRPSGSAQSRTEPRRAPEEPLPRSRGQR